MRSDRRYQVVDGQTDFSGGMRLVGDNLGPTEYRYSENMVVRGGNAETRLGFRRAFKLNSAAYNQGFWFNEDNVRYNDATHTGFWFPFSFAGELWIGLQGMTFFRFLADEYSRQLVVTNGTIFVHDKGNVYGIALPSGVEIGVDETVTFTQGNNKLVMFRYTKGTPDVIHDPLYWDGADEETGFQEFTSPGTTNRIPQTKAGAYMFGRLMPFEDDDIYASDSLDFDTYDYTYQLFGINKGDYNRLVNIVQFRDDYAVCFKNASTYLLKGANSYVVTGSELVDYVSIDTISKTKGLVGRLAYAVAGEQIAFLSYGSIETIERTQQGEVLGRDIPLSAPIQPLIDRINWKYASAACAIAYRNYFIFAVPTENSTVNNELLVYDLEAAGGNGAWVSVWKSELMTPVEFFVEEDKLYFLNSDGAMKLMFTESWFDSEDISVDVPIYDNSKRYEVGKHAWDGSSKVYKCLVENIGEDLTDTDFWEEQTDQAVLFQIASDIWTRFYIHGDEASPKRWGRCMISYKHQNPKITVQYETKDFDTVVDVFADTEYSQVKYDVNNNADWVQTNANLDYHTPYREDNSLFIPNAGMYVDDDGVYVDLDTRHALRFIPRSARNTEYSVRIQNNQGRLKISSILSLAQQNLFAKKEEG